MPLTTPDTVTARLDRLERESRRWRRAALGSWLAIAALLLLGQGPSRAPSPANPARTVEAERFVLRDARGRAGATLGWEANDTPRLALHDAGGQSRAVLTVGSGGSPGLTLLDADGVTIRAALVVGPDGAPGFALFDPDGKARLAAALFHGSVPGRAAGSREPTPAIVAYDAAGVVRATFGLRGSDAGLELADSRGTARTVLRIQRDGTPDLVLRDGDGRGRAGLSVLPDGTPTLNLNGPDGRARATLTLGPGRGAALALADGRGAVVWAAPPPP
jgi:hypothetical protein